MEFYIGVMFTDGKGERVVYKSYGGTNMVPMEGLSFYSQNIQMEKFLTQSKVNV